MDLYGVICARIAQRRSQTRTETFLDRANSSRASENRLHTRNMKKRMFSVIGLHIENTSFLFIVLDTASASFVIGKEQRTYTGTFKRQFSGIYTYILLCSTNFCSSTVVYTYLVTIYSRLFLLVDLSTVVYRRKPPCRSATVYIHIRATSPVHFRFLLI